MSRVQVWMVLSALLLTSGAAAQEPPSAYVVVDARQRWLSAGADPRWTPVDTLRRELRVDSIRGAPVFPRITLSAPCCGGGWTVAHEDGGPVLIEPEVRRSARLRPGGPVRGWEELYPARMPLQIGPAALGFALEDRLSAAPMLSAVRGTEGEWGVDTVRIEEGVDGNRVHTVAVRHARILESGVVDGRQEWAIRDSTIYQRTDEWRIESVYLGDSIRHRRELRGLSTGIVRYDPQQGIARMRSDTIRWKGTHWKSRYDGAFDSAAVEGHREVDIEWISVEEHDRRRTELERRPFMVLVPPPTPEDTLAFRASALGHLELGDSLGLRKGLTEWMRQHPREHFWWYQTLLEQVYGDVTTGSNGLWDHFTRARSAAGDTVGAIDGMRSVSHPELVTAALDILDDPIAVHRMGIDMDRRIDMLVNTLGSFAIPGSDHGRVARAWRPLIERRETFRDPRLRDLGLYAASMAEPADHYEEVVRRAEEGSLLAEVARAMSEGWARWPGSIGGFLTGSLEWQRPPGPLAPAPDAPAGDWAVWADSASSGVYVPASLHVYARRLGWDPYAGFTGRFEDAESDEERALFARLAIGVHRDFLTPERAAEWLLGGGPLRDVARAWTETFGSTAESPAAVAPILTRSLTQLVERGAYWEGDPVRPHLRYDGGDPRPVRMALPLQFREMDWRPPAGVELVDREELLYTQGGAVTVLQVEATVIGPIRRLSLWVAVGPIAGPSPHGPLAQRRDGIRMLFVETENGLVRIPGGDLMAFPIG